MFEALNERLTGVFDRITGRGALSEKDVAEAMREVRVALLEADVALPVVKDFIAFARDVAMHVAASPTVKYVNVEDVPQEEKDAELRVFVQQAEAEGKPENIREKIATGKLNKWLEEIVLVKQVHVNADKHESKTIEQIREQLSVTTGENVVVRRFERFAVGE